MPPAPTEARLRANVPRILWLNASFMFLVVMPIVVPFLRSHGLTLSQVYELQDILAFSDLERDRTVEVLSGVLERSRKL